MKKTYKISIGLLIIAAIVAAIIVITKKQKPSNETIIEDDGAVKEEVVENLKYGLPIDSFFVVYDTVKTGSTLSDILQPYQVSFQEIDKIVALSNDSLRVDRIHAGRPYAMFCSSDTSNGLSAELMVYENNGIDYTVYDFRDTVNVWKGQKPVEYREKSVKGIIESSLWIALKNQQTNTALALEMSEIFGWVIDFFGIQKGDEFRIVYEEVWVDDKPLYVNRIKAGMMLHMGVEYWAIPFTVDSVESFYEKDGASLRRTFLKAPLKYNRISSRFTNSRYHPIHKRNKPHRAVDYSAPTGTPIRTVGDGVITLRRYGKGAGNYIKVKHNSVYTTVYMHMSRFGKYQVGDRVKQGEIIGYVGSTGWATGPHLHFEVHKNGVQVDPLKIESPPANPVPDSLMDKFNREKAVWIEKIQNIEQKPTEN